MGDVKGCKKTPQKTQKKKKRHLSSYVWDREPWAPRGPGSSNNQEISCFSERYVSGEVA